MDSKYWYGLGGLMTGGLFMLALVFFFHPLHIDDIARIVELEEQVSDQRNTITAYQQALIGDEKSLLSMYDSVQQAGQIDIVVHSDTESGLPVKFILDCGGAKK